MKKIWIICLLGLSLGSFLAADERGVEIMTQVEKRLESPAEKSDLTMTITDRRGRERQRELALYNLKEGEEEYSLMFFTSPADVAGVGFLTRDEEGQESNQWLYMASLGRTRRIASSSKDDSFMGSDFSYEDLEPRDVEDDQHEFLREELVDGVLCWVVESIPRRESSYSRRVCWVDSESLILRRVDFYDHNDELLKQLIASDIQQIQGYWMALAMEMTNLQRDQSTLLLWQNVEFPQDLQQDQFTVGKLEAGL
ncbi:MAG: outer membrane lipoprotein-sorting protein [Spirochaetaceae bacterium]|jgi:outer membrane lipoprotein-sorting protein|nr:outer membrane lipoprotein-sorting protein [Spirochaetaceae bacterium]